jgi:hypothetical protein
MQKCAIKLCQVMGYDAGICSSSITICEEREFLKEWQTLLWLTVHIRILIKPSNHGSITEHFICFRDKSSVLGLGCGIILQYNNELITYSCIIFCQKTPYVMKTYVILLSAKITTITN